MNKKQIIKMLTIQEKQLWDVLQSAILVFGDDHEATKMSRARWSTTHEILKSIENENN